jgi:hypothetical protein
VFKSYFFIAVVLILLPYSAFSQWNQLSKPEKKWAIWHPFAALKVKKMSVKCYQIYNSLTIRNQLDTFSNGGQLDAFRHCFFMAAFTQKIKIKKIRKLGQAHEKGNYTHFSNNIKEDGELPDSIGTVMDLFNNELGFNYSKQHRKIELQQLALQILQLIKTGEALIVKRNSMATFLTCDDAPLKKETLKLWKNEKCLVKSDYIFR